MRKIFFFFAAMMVAITMNATPVAPGANALSAAITAADDGATIELAAGTFTQSSFTISKNITIQAADEANKPLLEEGGSIYISGDVNVKFVNIDFKADGSHDVFDISAGGVFELDGCEVYNFGGRRAIKVGNTAHTDAIKINNCYMHGGTNYPVIEVESNSTQNGCDLVEIKNSTFADFTLGEKALIALNSKNGKPASDASGPDADVDLIVDHCTFYNFTKTKPDSGEGSVTWGCLDLRKSSKATVSNCIFANPSEIPSGHYAHRASQLYGGTVSNCLRYNTPNHRSDDITINNAIEGDPLFQDAANGDFTLTAGSPALDVLVNSERINLGDPRWAPAPQQLYLKISSDWKYPSKYAIHYFDATTSGWSDFMTEVENENDIYTATIPTGYSKIIFARFNSTKASTGNWDDKWSQTVDLTMEDGKDLFTITSGGTGNECNGTWSLFEPTPACDWANIAWVDGSNSKLKVCKNGEVPSVVNVQKPGWAAESGIYMTFPSAAWDKSKFSLPASKYATEGAGMVIYLSALDLEYNEITVNCSNTDYIFTVYNVDGDEVVYNVAGSSTAAFGTSWDTYANKMTLNEGLYKWEKTGLELAAGAINFKVSKNHTWTESWPASDYVLNVAESGIYTISITFNESTKEINATATKTGEAIILPPVDVNGEWDDWDTPIVMEPATDKKSCSATYTFSAAGQYEFGIHVNGSWKTNGSTCTFSRANDSLEITGYNGNMNLDVDLAGEYTFTWYYETNVLKVTYPALPIKYCEYATGHAKNPNFGDPNGRILLTLRKSGNNIVVTVKNNNANGNTQTGLNYLWVNATGATNNNATYGSHETANTETVSVTVEFAEAKENYNFVNIHWAYAGFEGEWAIDGLEVKASELCQLENGYYLVGDFAGVPAWGVEDLTAAKKLVVNPGNAAEYMLENVTLAADDSLKVANVVNDAIEWYAPDAANYVVDANHAGVKTVYFRPAGDGGEGWWYHCIYVPENSGTAIDNTVENGEVVKFIRNGQLFIELNGKTYNVTGEVVR